MASKNIISDTKGFLSGLGVSLAELNEAIGESSLAAVALDTYLEAIRNIQIDREDPRRWTTETPVAFLDYQLKMAGIEINAQSRNSLSEGVIGWCEKVSRYPSINELATKRYSERFHA